MHVSSIFVNFFGYILVAFWGRFFLIRVASSGFTSSVSPLPRSPLPRSPLSCHLIRRLAPTPSPQGEGRGAHIPRKGKAWPESFHLIRRLRRHLPLKGKAGAAAYSRKGKAWGGSFHARGRQGAGACISTNSVLLLLQALSISGKRLVP